MTCYRFTRKTHKARGKTKCECFYLNFIAISLQAEEELFRLSGLDELPRGTDIPHHLSTDVDDLHEICWSGKLGRGGTGLRVDKTKAQDILPASPFSIVRYSFEFTSFQVEQVF